MEAYMLMIAEILNAAPNIKLEKCQFVNLWQLAADIKQKATPPTQQ